jgi:hypothetical protein
MAETVASKLSQLGGALMGLLGQIGGAIAKLPFMGAAAKGLMDSIQNAMKAPSAAQQEKDRADMDRIFGSHFTGTPGAKSGQVSMAPLIPFVKPGVNPAANPMATARANGSAGKKTVINNTTNIAPGAIVCNSKDPKVNADHVMREIDNRARHAASAATTAGGVDTSRYAFGAAQ